MAVVLCCGARPLQLARGVTVYYDTAEKAVYLHIEGVKRKEGLVPRTQSGQGHQEVWVARDTPESQYLALLARRVGALNGNGYVIDLRLPSKTPEQCATYWKDRVHKFGRKAFGRDFPLRLSPYVLRHAYSATLKDLKRRGALSDEEVAEALGHLSTRTPSGYARATQAKGARGPTVKKVSAPSPVRGRAPRPGPGFRP